MDIFHQNNFLLALVEYVWRAPTRNIMFQRMDAANYYIRLISSVENRVWFNHTASREAIEWLNHIASKHNSLQRLQIKDFGFEYQRHTLSVYVIIALCVLSYGVISLIVLLLQRIFSAQSSLALLIIGAVFVLLETVLVGCDAQFLWVYWMSSHLRRQGRHAIGSTWKSFEEQKVVLEGVQLIYCLLFHSVSDLITEHTELDSNLARVIEEHLFPSKLPKLYSAPDKEYGPDEDGHKCLVQCLSMIGMLDIVKYADHLVAVCS